MKKVMIILAALLVLPMATGICFAGDTTITHDADRSFNVADDTDALNVCTVALSKFVSFTYKVATDNQSYSIITLHWSGDKQYGTASDTTLIYWQLATTGTDVTAVTAADSTAVNGWNTM